MKIKSAQIMSPKSQLLLILLFPLIVDVFIGIAYMFEISFPLGKIYRGLIYAVGVFYILKYNHKGFFANFFLIWLIFFFIWLFVSENFSFSREISFFFKLTYLFPVLQIIKINSLSIPVKKDFIFFIIKRYSQIIALLVFFSFFTKIGLQTYGKWVFGTSSFFVAQNDIGLSHLLVFTFLLFNKKTVKINWFWLLLIFLSLILLGTSTGMFGALAIVLLYVFFKLILSRIVSVKNFFLRIFAVFSLIILFVVSSVQLYIYIKNSNYYTRKYDKILNEGFRSTLKDAGDLYFIDRGPIANAIGEGFSSYTYNLGETAPDIKLSKADFKDWLLVETDPYDIFGSFGIFLTIIFFSFYLFCFLLAILNYYNTRNVYNLTLLLIISMSFVHSTFAGHVMYSPTVLGVLVIFIYLIQTQYYGKI